MDFLQLARSRCSVRDYENKEVEQEKIMQILEAGRIAPSACNNQPIRLKVIQKDDMKRLANVYTTFHAPLAFLICADKKEAWIRKYDGKNSCDIDASIVCDHMMMEATALGLDSVWVCAFDPVLMRSEFALSDNLEPINLLICGYGKNGTKKSEERYTRERKAIHDILI